MKTSNLVLIIIFLLAITKATEAQNTTVSSYDPAELLTRIFSPNATVEARQRGYGLIKFEDQDPGQYPDPERDQTPLRFEDDNYAPYYSYNNDQNYINNYVNEDQINNGQVTFQDDNKIEGNKKKRKRRRKPKNGVLPGAGQPIPGYGNPYPGYPYGQPYRPPRRRRPRPSLASAALSSVTEALTSIATYDDYQCVPRLLCEAAGGGGLSNNGLLQSVAGIQPLLGILSAYNGISTSPLFVFGRAVFLGMTSKGNTGTCRYAYPQCPTDPEELIFYLNNYNGGFFRFFSAPQGPPQNIEQFYNHLGQYQGPIDPNNPQGPYPNYPQSSYDQNYGHNHFDNNYNRPSLYNNNQGNYAYNYNYNTNQIRFQDDNRIQKRIQNRPNHNLIEDSFEDNDDYRSGWLFPDETNNNYYNNYDVRDSKTMRFPDSETHNPNDYRKGKVITYPEHVYNTQTYNDRPHTFSNRYETTTYSYNNGQNYNNYQTTSSNYNTNNYYNHDNKYYNNNHKPNDYQNNQNYNNQGIKYYNYNQSPSDNPNYNHNYNRPNNNQNYYYDNNNNAVKITYNQIPANNYNGNNQNYYNNHQNMYSNNQKYPQSTVFNNQEYVYDHKHNFYVKKENNDYNQNNNNYNYNKNQYNENANNYNQNYNYNSNKYNQNNNDNYNKNYYKPNNNYYDNNFKRGEPDNGLKTVYVVRGHGDPNKPEIVKLKPGQSVH